MSREQADAVALAVDGLDLTGPMRSGSHDPAKPLSDTFYKNCLASGAITPPLGESAAVRRNDLFVGWCAICFVLAGVGAFLAAMWWR